MSRKWALLALISATSGSTAAQLTTSSAPLTTSLPIPFGTTHDISYGYLASVIDVRNDATTLAVVWDADVHKQISEWNSKSHTEKYHYVDSSDVMTYTWTGTTKHNQRYTTDYNLNTRAPTHEASLVTFTESCNIETGTATCTGGLRSADDFYQYCTAQSRSGQEYPSVITISGRRLATTGTDGFTYSYITVDLGFCKTASEVPDSVVYSTKTYAMSDAKFVITAGAEKLAKPTGTQPTGTGAADTAKKGVAPLMTMAPVWAGLGVAAAALAL